MSKKNINEEGEKKRSRLTAWIPRWISLPLVIIVTFLVVMVFFGDNSYIKSNEYAEKIYELEKEIQANKDSAKYYQRKSKELVTDCETLEKIAREQYGMKRDNEDVYITEIP